MNASDLPIRFGMHSYVQYIGYTNPLPDWYGFRGLDFSARASRLADRINRYLRHEPPLPALVVSVPARSGDMREWVVPAVNDQMVLTTCAYALSDSVRARIDDAHVYSCRPSGDPSSFALVKDQFEAWWAFQDETVKRARSGLAVVEFDIRRAYVSARLDDFIAFIDGLGGNPTAIAVISHLLNTWRADVEGVPLINDAVFFLGSAYLNRIDDVVKRSTNNFIRFVDDYRVFTKDLSTAEQLYERIGKDIAGIGFFMNPKKARISSASDYLQRSPAVVREQHQNSSIVRLNAQLLRQYTPDQTASLIGSTLSRPAQYLNDGLGRSLMGLLAKYHFETGGSAQGLAGLQHQLRQSKGLLPQARQLLAEYAKVPSEYWRIIWLTYMVEQCGDAGEFADTLQHIEHNPQMQTVAQLWARRCVERRPTAPPIPLEQLHEIGYVDAGMKCYGGVVCNGAAS